MQARMRGAASSLIRVYRRCLDGIDLLGHFHRRQLRANASAHPATHYQTGDDRTGLVDNGEHDRGGKQRFGAKPSQAVSGLPKRAQPR